MNSLNVMCAVAALTAVCGPASAVVIASQDFEGNSLTPARTSIGGGFNNTLPFGEAPGEFSDNDGLGWETIFFDFFGQNPFNTPIEGSDTDMIGVRDGSNSFPGFPFTPPNNDLAGVPGSTGQYFVAEDTDGSVAVLFDPIDVSDFTELELSFTLAVHNTQYDGADRFTVLAGTSALSGFDLIDTSFFTLSQGSLDSGGDFSDEFVEVTLSLDAFEGTSSLYLGFVINTDADNETIAFDNVVVSGVPTPGAVSLLGAAGIVATRRRRR